MVLGGKLEHKESNGNTIIKKGTLSWLGARILDEGKISRSEGKKGGGDREKKINFRKKSKIKFK